MKRFGAFVPGNFSLCSKNHEIRNYTEGAYFPYFI